jgi:glycosyltransferase involved in cell wall biosynthesis
VTGDRGVSFVLTVFNKERHLEATLRSVLGQEGDFARQVIVVDDGSSDRSLEIANDLLADHPEAKVIHQANRGPARALNAGVAAATMAVVKPFDGDDVMTPDATQRLLAGLDRPDVVLVRGDRKPQGHPGAPLVIDRRGRAPDFRYMEDPLSFAIRHSFAGCSDILFRRPAFVACGGCDPSVFVQDYSLVWRLAIGNVFAITDDIIAFSQPEDENNLSNNRAQVEHDRNAALYGLVRDHPDLPHALKRMTLRLAAGRAWKWARRINERPWGADRAFWICLLSYLPWLPRYERWLGATLAPYRVSGEIRLPNHEDGRGGA